MSLLENLMVIPEHQRGETLWGAFSLGPTVEQQERDAHEVASAALEFVELFQLRNEPARVLSGGQRKLLEIARALMATPRMILLDEPGAGVKPALMRRIVTKIEEMAASGISFLLIEHGMDLVMGLYDPILVMNEGTLLMAGRSHEVRSDARVLEAYLGAQTSG